MFDYVWGYDCKIDVVIWVNFGVLDVEVYGVKFSVCDLVKFLDL